MAGQRAGVHGEDARVGRQSAAPASPAAGSHRVPGQAEPTAAAPAPRRAARRSGAVRPRGQARAARPAPALLLAAALPAVGAAADEVTGGRVGWSLLVASVAAAVLAAAVCSRAGAWWLIPLPPLVVAAVTVVAETLARPSSAVGGQGPAAEAVRWGVEAFPAMAAGESAVLVVLAVRLLRPRRRGRTGRA